MAQEGIFHKDEYVNVKGVRTRYWHVGEGGSIVILIHGLGGSIESWAYNIRSIARFHEVYALDLIGFGRTDKPEGEYTYSFFSSFLRDFMAKVGIESATIAGHSLGGGTALQFAISYPHMADKLILVSTGGLSKKFSLGLRVLTLPLVGEVLSRASKKSCSATLERIVYDRSVIEPDWVDLYYEMSSLPGTQVALLKTLRAGSTLFGGKRRVMDPISRGLDSIACRTLVIWGKNDNIIPFEISQIALDEIKNSELFTLDKCGHAPIYEYPDRVNDRITSFLEA